MKLKICGMKYQDNIKDVANLQPDYLGFIFFKGSKRNFTEDIPELPEKIKKTGVFVNATIGEIFNTVLKYKLSAIQLHGEESVAYCHELKQKFEAIKALEIIKVFSVGDSFDFKLLLSYEEVCDYFLFDTKGKERGGNGITFDWKILQQYPSKKPFYLSGGIGLDEMDSLKAFLTSDASRYCYAIDVNSKFEIEPGLKKIDELKMFIRLLKQKI